MGNLLQIKPETHQNSSFFYNAMLVGFGIGSLWGISIPLLCFSFFAGGLTFMLTLTLATFLYNQFALPVLSLPFYLTISLIYALPHQIPGAAMPNPFLMIPFPFEKIGQLLKAFGAVLFLPYPWAGALLITLILIRSRILFIAGIAGYLGGGLLHCWLGGLDSLFMTGNFNYALTVMALFAVFHIPSLKSAFMAAIGTLACVLISILLYRISYLLPIYPLILPFNLATLLVLYGTKRTFNDFTPRLILGRPEDTLDHHLANPPSTTQSIPKIQLPFKEEWTVWQVFNDEWTHQGIWKHAYDFIVADPETGQPYTNKGNYIENYLCFGKPVYSPVNGVVATVINHLPDNKIGSVDQQNRWGNLVIIYDDRGFYVTVSHFQEQSITVQVGERVSVSSYLGKCGNSGYSPQPHLHVQVQAVPAVGAPTIPFEFQHFIQHTGYIHGGLPEKNTPIKPAEVSQTLDSVLCAVLDQQLHYNLIDQDRIIDRVTFTIRISPQSEYYLDAGDAQLYFSQTNGFFQVHSVRGNNPALTMIYKALARIPLAPYPGFHYATPVSIRTACPALVADSILFINILMPGFLIPESQFRIESPTAISGTFTALFRKEEFRVEFDSQLFFKRIQIKETRLERREL